MDPDLAKRLRRFGEQVDQAAVAAQAGRPLAPPSARVDADDTDELATVVPFVATRPNRRFQLITAAAAAGIVVVAGALVTWRITGESDPGRADSTQVTVNTTARPSTTSTSTTSIAVTTTLPILGPGGPASSTTSTTTTTTTTPVGSSTSATGTRPPVCPDYVSYGTSYPIRLCDTGPAVSLIQERVGAPEIDGYFGPATRQSVIVFQQISGLNDDGLVGPMTWAAMFPDGAPGADADGDGIVEPWEVP
jgi:hypothetical protein